MSDEDKEGVGDLESRGIVHLASMTWDRLVELVNRNLPLSRQITLNPKDFSSSTEAEKALKKTPRGRLWAQEGKSLLITRWFPQDATRTFVVVGSATIIATGAALLLQRRKKSDKKVE